MQFFKSGVYYKLSNSSRYTNKFMQYVYITKLYSPFAFILFSFLTKSVGQILYIFFFFSIEQIIHHCKHLKHADLSFFFLFSYNTLMFSWYTFIRTTTFFTHSHTVLFHIFFIIYSLLLVKIQLIVLVVTSIKLSFITNK